MTAETKTCQNCKSDFQIEPEDFEFYAKIKVPAPTFCPECRLQRRLMFRNERMLYKRQCGLCSKNIVTRFSSDVPFPVYCLSCWHSDKWDPLDYGQDYDFNVPFFVQLKELQRKVPRPALYAINAVNSDYCNQCVDVKNVYLSASIVGCEDVYYSYRADKTKDSFDVAYARESEMCYGGTDLIGNSTVHFSQYVRGSYDSELLYDVRGSHHCFGCVNVRNAKHQMFNKQYSQEEYKKERKKYDLGSYKVLSAICAQFDAFKLSFPRRYAMFDQTQSVIGNNVQNARNLFHCFDTYNAENCKYVLGGISGIKDSYDVSYGGLNAELCYDGWSIVGSGNKFSTGGWGQNVEYCDACFDMGCSDLFGCVAIHSRQQYLVLNKEYSPEDYTDLVGKIKQHMVDMPYIDKRGIRYTYGEFFPYDFSVHGYNETTAQEYFPLTKEEAMQKGFSWKDPDQKGFAITVHAQDLPDHIRDVPDNVVDEVIACLHEGKCNEQCTVGFRIIPQELDFLRKINVALPRLCPNCRHHQRVRSRNSVRLWHRVCQCAGAKSENGIYQNTIEHFHKDTHCPNEFETSYAPDRPEIIYCEQCYQAEVV